MCVFRRACVLCVRARVCVWLSVSVYVFCEGVFVCG